MPILHIHPQRYGQGAHGLRPGQTGRVRASSRQGHGACRARARGQEDVFEQAGTADQGRHRGAGIAHRCSNVMLVCGQLRPVRVGFKVEGDHKVRVCKKCGQTLPTKK